MSDGNSFGRGLRMIDTVTGEKPQQRLMQGVTIGHRSRESAGDASSSISHTSMEAHVRGSALALADEKCPQCAGMGAYLDGRGGALRSFSTLTRRREVLCRCVARHIFRAVYGHAFTLRSPARPRLAVARGSFGYALPHSDYCVDFELVARRALGPHDYELFKMYWLDGAPWRECARVRRLADPRAVFARLYAIERALGEAYLANGLYPPSGYYEGREYSVFEARQLMRRKLVFRAAEDERSDGSWFVWQRRELAQAA